MHIVITLLPLAGYLALEWASDRWNKRPALRARWAARSLRSKIDYTVRARRIAVTIQAGLLALSLALWQAGILPAGGLVIGGIITSLYLIIHLYLLHNALAARRAYDQLGPLAYVAEVQHAFGSTVPATDSDRSEVTS